MTLNINFKEFMDMDNSMVILGGRGVGGDGRGYRGINGRININRNKTLDIL